MGGQDELANSTATRIIVDATGQLLARGPQFEETLLIADLELPRPTRRCRPRDASRRP